MLSSSQLVLRTGLPASEANDLLESGVVALDTAEMPEQERFAAMRSEPINVFAPSMDLAEYEPCPPGLEGDVILVDTHTGAALTPLRVRPAAVFGREGFRLPMSWPSTPIGWARARFGAIPYFVAEDVESLMTLTRSFSAHNSNLYYRGMTQEYLIRRKPSVTSLFYGTSDVREISLPSADFRRGFDFAGHESTIQLIFSEIEFQLTQRNELGSKLHWVEDDIEMLYVGGGGGASIDWRGSTMAAAQHYGIPTPGLDITRSSRVAWWFATHEFCATTGTYSTYSPQGDLPIHDRPVIYVFDSRHTVELGALAPLAKRPAAQEGLFLHGSWGRHGNVCAEDLIAIVILGADVEVCDEPLDNIFPPAASDPVYRELLKLKRLLSDEPFAEILRHVYEVHQSTS